MLKFELNVAERKTLAKRMEELTGIHPYYTKAPLYSYDIGSYTIDRDGNLLVEPENADAELLTTLLNEGLIRGGESIESSSENVHYQAEKLQKCTRSFCLIFVEYMFFYILAIIRT